MARNTGLAAFLAREVTSDTAHRAVLASGLKWPTEELALNPAISEEIWQQLATIKSDVRLTQNLVTPNLTEEKIRLLLKDKRVAIQELLFKSSLGSISYELAQEIAASKALTVRSARWWIDAGTVPKQLLAKVARVAGGEYLARYISDPELFMDEEVLEILPKIGIDYMIRLALVVLFDLRPSLVTQALKIDRLVVLDALAGCRHIFDQNDFLSIISKVTVVVQEMNETKTVAAPRDPYLVRDILLGVMDNPNSTQEVAELAYSALPRTTYLDLAPFTRYVKRANSGKRKEAITVDWNTLPTQTIKKLLPGTTAKNYPTLEYAKSLPKERSNIPRAATKQPVVGRKNLATFKVSDFHPSEQLNQRQLLAEIQKPLDAKGYNAWSMLLALSLEWESSIQSLLETAIGLAD